MKFENELGHATLPIRNSGAVRGKGAVPTLKSLSGKSRISFTEKDEINVTIGDDDEAVKFDRKLGLLSFTYLQPPYRPLGAYKALCKSAMSIVPDVEIENFGELMEWLREPDFLTKRVYSSGLQICLASFVPAF
jgi:hypothetical protein